MLKNEVKGSAGWNSAHGSLFSGLPAGLPFVIGIVAKIAEQFTGIDVQVWVDMWNANPVAGAIDGIVQDALSVIFQVSANLQALFQSINFLDPDFDPATALIDFATALFNLLNPAQFFGLFGGVLELLFSAGSFILPMGSLSTASPNRLPDGDFPDGSIPPASGGWFVNLDFSLDDDDTGVAEITADGGLHQLVSGDTPSERIPVGQGQALTVEIHAAHTGATWVGGAPLSVILLRYNGDIELTPVVLNTYTPNSATLALPGTTLTKKYSVPAGVTHVQVMIEVNENAKTGIWRFDKGRLFSDAEMGMFPGVSAALLAGDQKIDEVLKGIATVAKGFPILDKIGVDDAMEALAAWNPVEAFNQVQRMLSLATGALLRRPMPNASAEDFANALAQQHNIPGVDESTYIVATVTATIPSFADEFDALAIGRGQDGLDGFLLMFGQGGAPGVWEAVTWEDGTHYTKGVTAYTVTFESNGDVTVSIPGHSFTAERGTGPLQHSPLFVHVGRGAADIEYNDKPYVGGGNATFPGQAGTSPGGGGAGGRGIVIPNGGPGGDPAAWVRFRSDSVVIETPSSGTDGSPPTLPNILEVTRVSHNTIWVKGGGSVDV